MPGIFPAAFSLISCCLLSSAANDIGLQLKEHLQGYYSIGEMSFEAAYDEGKKADRSFSFSCSLIIPHMRAFVNDSQHVAECVGNAVVLGLTPKEGSQIINGSVEIFDGGVQNHQLEMHYFLPFVGSDSQNYTLQGVKHINGSDCLNLLKMSTTLYTYVRQNNTTGKILMTGIVKIDALGILALLESIRIAGNGTDADKLDVLFEFSKFLLTSVESDCLNMTNWETRFWYTWASDGKQGFLLDLIQRPDRLELRLELYSVNKTPEVHKQYLDLSQLHVDKDQVKMGPLALSNNFLSGNVNSVNVDLSFRLSNGSNHFLPTLLANASKGIIPDIFSRYGDISAGAVGYKFETQTPIVYTTYAFKVGLNEYRWAMISAMRFVDNGTGVATNLKIEIVALLYGSTDSLAFSYVQYHGTEHHLDPLTSDSKTKMTHMGSIHGNQRLFGAEISSLTLNMTIKCQAPTDQFALLDQEGKTVIHTTVLGECYSYDRDTGATFVCSNCALLEIKTL